MHQLEAWDYVRFLLSSMVYPFREAITYPDFIGVITHLLSASAWVDVFSPVKVEPMYVLQHHTIAIHVFRDGLIPATDVGLPILKMCGFHLGNHAQLPFVSFLYDSEPVVR